MNIRTVSFGHPDAARLNDRVQLEYAERYGDEGDVTYLDPAMFEPPQGLYLIVSNMEAARNELVACIVKVSEVFHAGTPGAPGEGCDRARARLQPGSRGLTSASPIRCGPAASADRGTGGSRSDRPEWSAQA